MLLSSTSIVYAQEIKITNQTKRLLNENNIFQLDSLGLKEFSALIQEHKKLPLLYKGFQLQLLEKDSEIKLLNDKIAEYKDNIFRFDKAMKVKDENIMFIEKKHKHELKKVKWQRNKSYIFGGAAIIIGIVLSAN